MERVAIAAILMCTTAGTAAAHDTTAATDSIRGAGAQRFDIDRAHTHVGFIVRHLAVANVRGRFTRFSGHIFLDESDITRSTVEVVIDAASIDTDNGRRDEHLRSDDFFDVERFPTLRFVGRRVERSGDALFLVGDLTIRDVTREVRMPFELTGPVNGGNDQRIIGAEGSLRVNRFDYGLRWNRFTEAVQVVGNEVRIELQIEARTPRPAQP
jgi:polyisoprenoid-binding protein YceI